MYIENDLFEFALSPEQVSSLKGEDRSRVSLGIRPEYLKLKADDSLFHSEITLIEPQGERDTIHLKVGNILFEQLRLRGELRAREPILVLISRLTKSGCSTIKGTVFCSMAIY